MEQNAYMRRVSEANEDFYFRLEGLLEKNATLHRLLHHVTEDPTRLVQSHQEWFEAHEKFLQAHRELIEAHLDHLRWLYDPVPTPPPPVLKRQ